MSILNNELVRRYFSCGTHSGGCICPEGRHNLVLAYAVLNAMEEPIKIGDKLLRIIHADRVEEYTAKIDAESGFDHGSIVCLRLPSKFQPSREKCDELRHQMGYELCSGCGQKKPDPVEEKISEIYAFHHDGHFLKETASLDQRLRELVELARQHD